MSKRPSDYPNQPRPTQRDSKQSSPAIYGMPQQSRSAANRSQATSSSSYHQPKHRSSSSELSREYVKTKDGTTIVRVKKRKNKARRRIIIVAVVVLAIVGIGAGTVFGLTSMGKANLHQAPEEIEVNEEAVSFNDGRTVEYNGHTYAYNENVVSICLIGYDRTGNQEEEGIRGQSDAIMVAALDTETGKASVIAIPRNSLVDVPEYYNGQYLGTQKDQICLAFASGANDAESSEIVTTVATRVLYNMPINYYYAIDRQALGMLADAIGGVSLTALQTIPGTNIYEGEDVILLGNNAIKYVQWRDTTNYLSPLDRQERQIQFVKALASQALSALKSNPSIIVDLFNAMSSYATTNLGVSEVSYLASVLASHGISDLNMIKLEGTMEPREYSSEFILDQSSVYQTVLDVYYTQLPDSESTAAGDANAAENTASEASGAASEGNNVE